MKNVLIAAFTLIALVGGSLAVASPASAKSLAKFCYFNPYAPICWEFQHHHHHHHHNDYYWWY